MLIFKDILESKTRKKRRGVAEMGKKENEKYTQQRSS